MKCREVELACPDTNSTFLTTSCCYSTGPISSNCFLARPSDLATLCPLYSCYLYDQVVPPTPPLLAGYREVRSHQRVQYGAQ